jgi:hypothetical protein
LLKHRSAILAVAWTLFDVVTVTPQESGMPPQPSAEHKKLGVFVGTWNDEALMKPGPFGPGGKMNLTETCDWFTGGFSLICHTETTGYLGHLKTLTVLTYDSGEKKYRLHEFNSVGWSSSATGAVDGDTWTFDSESKIGERMVKTRSTIKMSAPDSALMTSEVSVEGGPMTLLMELKGTRLKQNAADSEVCGHASEGWIFECFQKWSHPQ